VKSKYKLPLPIIRPSIRSIAFAGSGPNNLTSAGDFTGKNTTVFTVKIDTDTSKFVWKKDSASFSAPISIIGSNQTLSDGVSVKLPVIGHIANDTWTITVTVYGSVADVKRLVPDWQSSESDEYPKDAAVDRFLDRRIAIIYTLAANHGYPLPLKTERQAIKYGEILEAAGKGIVLISKAFQSGSGELVSDGILAIRDSFDLEKKLLAGELFNSLKA
jgi:hypothetical protein